MAPPNISIGTKRWPTFIWGGLEHESMLRRRVNGTLCNSLQSVSVPLRSTVEELPNMPAEIRSCVY